MANNKIKFLRGTSDEYTAAEKDNDTIYFTTDDGKLYVGDKEILGESIKTLNSHINDSVKHITSTERTNWNAAKAHADSAHAPSNAQANVIETIKVNGTALTPSSKAVDITVPSVGNGTITIKQEGTIKGTFTTNQSGNTTIELTDNNATYGVATSSTLGLVKSGTDITVDSSGNVSINDDSHNHVISNVDGLQSALDGKAASSHTHDDRYYTESEVDIKLNGKANASHGNHVPTTETANNAVFLRNDNTWATITPANIGAAATSHSHNYAGSSSAGGAATTALDCTGNAAAAGKLNNAGQISSVAALDGFLEANRFKYATIGAISGLSGTYDNNDGMILSVGWENPAWGHQIFIDDSSYDIHHRYRTPSNEWQAWSKILDTSNYKTYCTPANIGAAAASHTHNYAGSSSAGGAATTALACTGNAATATKATQDSAGQKIDTTYIKGLSASSGSITYTKGDNTTGTITTVKSIVITLSASGWNSNSQTISVSEVNANSIVFITPAPQSQDEYIVAYINCTNQDNGSLTFTCKYIPENDLQINLVIL